MKQYTVKFFEENPFDKSECAKNVQVLCDKKTDEPFAILESEIDLTGETILQSQIIANWSSKRTKHIVVGDKVVFGQNHMYSGTVSEIKESANEDDEDIFLIKEIESTLSKVPALAKLYENKKKEESIFVTRDKVNVKPWIKAELNDTVFAWKQMEKNFYNFLESQPTKEQQFDWWKNKFENKII
jgi:hypothetical protein